MRRGLALRAYLGLSHLAGLLAKPILRRRLKRGKEHPERWMEKCGQNLASRPTGPVIWLHAVGLGEVMSLRGLIKHLSNARPDLSFLVTSTTRASAEVFAQNAPDRTLHQFLPLDVPAFRRRFLTHFHPDLCVWIEQDIWPGFVSDIARAKIPQCVVAARMDAVSGKARRGATSLFRDLYAAMALVTAQDQQTAAQLSHFAVTAQITGSLKPAAPALSVDAATLAKMQNQCADRFVWAVAPAHPADISLAVEAHNRLRKIDASALLIIAPRFPGAYAGPDGPRWSKGEMPTADDAIWICDTFGDLGLVYRSARAVLIGGTFNEIEGHNPWEAAALGCATLHGPRTANFATDFAMMDAAEATISVASADDILASLTKADLSQITKSATRCIAEASSQTKVLAGRLIELLDGPYGK